MKQVINFKSYCFSWLTGCILLHGGLSLVSDCFQLLDWNHRHLRNASGSELPSLKAIGSQYSIRVVSFNSTLNGNLKTPNTGATWMTDLFRFQIWMKCVLMKCTSSSSYRSENDYKNRSFIYYLQSQTFNKSSTDAKWEILQQTCFTSYSTNHFSDKFPSSTVTSGFTEYLHQLIHLPL